MCTLIICLHGPPNTSSDTLEHNGTMWVDVTRPSLTAVIGQLPRLCASREAFAVIKGNGSVVTWGNENCGGNCSEPILQGELGGNHLGVTHAVVGRLW